MRLLGNTLLVLGTGACVLSSCNALLGIEDDYRLVDDCESGECGGAESGGQGGGAGERGGSSGTSTGGTRPTGGMGPAGAAGEPGTGGGGGCVATGAEQCLNGLDDDCNGDIDCADAACAGPVECVPAPGNATPSTFVAMDADCPNGYSPVTLQRGLSASTDCTGCTCVSPQTICTSGVYAHGTFQCGGSQYTGLLYNVYNDSCQPLPADRNLYMFERRELHGMHDTGHCDAAARDVGRDARVVRCRHRGRRLSERPAVRAGAQHAVVRRHRRRGDVQRGIAERHRRAVVHGRHRQSHLQRLRVPVQLRQRNLPQRVHRRLHGLNLRGQPRADWQRHPGLRV